MANVLSEKTFHVTQDDIHRALHLCKVTKHHSWYNPIALAVARELGEGTLCTLTPQALHIYRKNTELSLRINIANDGTVLRGLYEWWQNKLQPFKFTITLYGGKSFT